MKDGGLGSLEPLSATWGKDISSPALVSTSVKQEVPVISDVLEESWLPLEHRVSLGVGVGRDLSLDMQVPCPPASVLIAT